MNQFLSNMHSTSNFLKQHILDKLDRSFKTKNELDLKMLLQLIREPLNEEVSSNRCSLIDIT